MWKSLWQAVGGWWSGSQVDCGQKRARDEDAAPIGVVGSPSKRRRELVRVAAEQRRPAARRWRAASVHASAAAATPPTETVFVPGSRAAPVPASAAAADPSQTRSSPFPDRVRRRPSVEFMFSAGSGGGNALRCAVIDPVGHEVQDGGRDNAPDVEFIGVVGAEWSTSVDWIVAHEPSATARAVVTNAVSPALSQAELVATIGKLTLRRADMRCLIGGAWLTDEVVNFYFETLKARQRRNESARPGKQRTAYFFSTFFFARLYHDRMAYDFAKVQRWTRGVDILADYSLLLVPIHLGVHWALAVVDLVRRRIIFYDSLRGDAAYTRRSRSMLLPLARYLADESSARGREALDATSWSRDIAADAPRQTNSSDCGMFVCKVAEALSGGTALSAITQSKMPRFRIETVHRFLNHRSAAAASP